MVNFNTFDDTDSPENINISDGSNPTLKVTVDASGRLFTKDASNGPVTPGTVASFSTLIGGQFNTALPTLTTTQQASLQVDSSGRLIIAPLTTLPLPAGAATSALQTTGNSTLTAISGKLPATLGQKAMTASLSVVIASNQSEVPISAASLPLPTGASTAALQTTGNNSLASIDTKLTAPLVVTGPLTDTQLRATPVPVSGTVASTQSGTWNLNNITGTVSLPTGASTSALQTTGNTSVANIDTKTPALVSGRVPVDGSGVTQPVSAVSLPLPAGASTAALQTTGNSSLSSIDSKLTAPLSTSELSHTNFLSGSITSLAIQVEAKVGVSAMTNRRMLSIYNGSNSVIYFGPTGVTTSTGEPLEKKQKVNLPLSSSVFIISSGVSAGVIVQEFK